MMQHDPDRAAALDRAHAELSRLGAPLEAEHGADTMLEAQTASAAAAGGGAGGVSAVDGADVPDEPDELDEPDEPTQAVSTAELLAETGESEALAEAAEDDGDEPTQAVSTADLLAETSAEELIEAVPPLGDADEDEPTTVVPALAADAGSDSGSDSDSVDDEPTQAVPSVAAGSVESQTQPMSAAELLAKTSTDAVDDEPTQAVPSSAASAAITATPDDEPTRAVPSVAASSATPDDEPTQAVASAGSAAPDNELTRPVPILAADVPGEELTRPVPRVGAGSPDESSTEALTLATPEPAQTKPEGIAAPTLAVAPPTQAAQIVPPAGFQQQYPQQPQPQPFAQQPYPQPQPQQHSAAPPTQAAAAYSPPPPPPGAPNPWLQQPQQPQNPWQNQGGAPPPGAGGWGPNQPPGGPFYPMQTPPPKKNNGKTIGIVVGAVAAVAAVVLVVVLASKGNGSKDNVGTAGSSTSHSATGPSSVPDTNFPTGTKAPTSHSSSSPSPSDSSSSDTDSPSDTTSSSSDAYTPPPDLTSTPFDPSVLNEGATDKTPMTLEALAPQDFTDDRGVHYSLKAGSIQPCVQTDMSANMKDILTSNSCTKEVAASYVDDSGQYLVSVKVLPLPDQHTATVVYNDLAQQNAADFGIWCPQSGPGSTACQGDYRSATIKQYREQQHRYVVLSVALAVNHSESSTIAPWLDAAAKKAVDAAGPDNWSGNQ
ncbi:hypothetical protein ACFQ9X_45125 [Catenulispora yoronensis]